MKRLPMTPENMRKSLDGTKTMTRRVMVPQPQDGDKDIWPKYSPGDVVMLTSTWAVHYVLDDRKPSELTPEWRGDRLAVWLSGRDGEKPAWAGKSRPAMFAPLALTDLFPRAVITDVKAERVHNISVADMVAEGVTTTLREHDAVCDLRCQWINLWDSINAKRGYGWDVNPWVVTYTYEVVR